MTFTSGGVRSKGGGVRPPGFGADDTAVREQVHAVLLWSRAVRESYCAAIRSAHATQAESRALRKAIQPCHRRWRWLSAVGRPLPHVVRHAAQPDEAPCRSGS